MNLRANSLLPAILLGLCLTLPVRAQGGRWDPLLKSNPFYSEPPAPVPVEPAPQLELRGVLVEGKVTWLNVYDADTKESAWVQRGDRMASFAIGDYDPARETLILDYRQKPVSVALKQSRVQLMAGSNRSSVARASAGSMSGGLSRSSVAVAVMPAGESQRLEQVAMEIRQRREQRQKKKPAA